MRTVRLQVCPLPALTVCGSVCFGFTAPQRGGGQLLLRMAPCHVLMGDKYTLFLKAGSLKDSTLNVSVSPAEGSSLIDPLPALSRRQQECEREKVTLVCKRRASWRTHCPGVEAGGNCWACPALSFANLSPTRIWG